LEDFLIGIKF